MKTQSNIPDSALAHIRAAMTQTARSTVFVSANRQGCPWSHNLKVFVEPAMKMCLLDYIVSFGVNHLSELLLIKNDPDHGKVSPNL